MQYIYWEFYPILVRKKGIKNDGGHGGGIVGKNTILFNVIKYAPAQL